MLMRPERRPAIRTIEGWARSVLLEAGALRECELHGWMIDRADPHARELGLALAAEAAASGLTPQQARAALELILDSAGDTCPECG